MKAAKNLHASPMTAIVAGVTACGLFVVGLVGWWRTGAGYAQNWSFITSTCCVVGAGGVIWLGWYWLRLAGEIRSITGQLKQKQLTHIKPVSNEILNALSKAINERFGGNTDYIARLEKQIKSLKIQVQLSQKQKRNAEAIIYSIRDAVVVDEYGKLLMANEAAEKLFDFDFKTSKHKPINEVISTDKTEFTDFLNQIRQSKVRHTKREMKFSEGTRPRTFDCIASCVYDESEQVCGVVAVLHEITREKEISQMKNDFVSHVSHELKTPLASITAYSEMLFDGEADDEETRKEFYSVIQSQAKRLNRLIEDILNISRIESGLIKVKKTPVSLTILIEEQLQMIKSYAEEKNIEIIGQKPIVFDQVYVDKDMISQVIVNLLSNAVKYTPSGGSVEIKTEVDEITSMVKVRVTDTGVGIPEDEVEHVFDKFYRVDANKTQAKGTGLGLNLVKQIVEKVHNGRVFVSSEQGAGSTFAFELPLATELVMRGT